MIYTNNLIKKLFYIAPLWVFSMVVYGEPFEHNPASIPSLIDYTNGDGLVQVLGVKYRYGRAYRGSDKSVLEVTLDGATQWRKGRHLFFIENYDLNGIEIGWRTFTRSTWVIQSGVRHETVHPSSKTAEGEIDNFPHRGSQVFGFFELRRSLDASWRNWVTGRISGGPGDFGFRAELALGHQFVWSVSGAAVELELYSTFGDEKQLNNYFGVSQLDANASGLTQTNLDGGYRSSGINAIYRQRLFNNVQGVITGRLEYYSAEVVKSSLVRDDEVATVDVSLLYRF